MSDRIQAEPPEPLLVPNIARQYTPLPRWLERRLLDRGAELPWVRGPRLSPRWERYAPPPALFVVALAVGAACLWAGALVAGSWSEIPWPLVLAAGIIVLTSIFVLGLSAGYFT